MKPALAPFLLLLVNCGGGVPPGPGQDGGDVDAGPACDGGCTLCGIDAGMSLSQADALAGTPCASNYDGGAGYVSWILPTCTSTLNEQVTAYVVDGTIQSMDSFHSLSSGVMVPGLVCP